MTNKYITYIQLQYTLCIISIVDRDSIESIAGRNRRIVGSRGRLKNSRGTPSSTVVTLYFTPRRRDGRSRGVKVRVTREH